MEETQLLYANSGLWENSTNVIIILNNIHRIKDDLEICGNIEMNAGRNIHKMMIAIKSMKACLDLKFFYQQLKSMITYPMLSGRIPKGF